jgi:hypothetical protein
MICGRAICSVVSQDHILDKIAMHAQIPLALKCEKESYFGGSCGG